MEDKAVEYLDLHSETKYSIFGACCLLTLLAFCYVLYRLAVSPSKMPWSELSVILLSCCQLLFGIFFYFGRQHPFLQILNKAIKVAQAEIISWSCLAILLAHKKKRRRRAAAMLNLFSTVITIVLVYGCFTVDVSTTYLNAKIGIFMSMMWFAMSMAVLYTAFKIRKNLDILSLLKFEDADKPSLEKSGLADFELFGKAGGDIVDSYTDQRYKQFMLLVVVETVTAVGTLIWDITLYCSIHISKNGREMELEMPLLKEFLHITSNIILMFIPNWTVFYVFYWVQRRNYKGICSTWDINMNNIRFEVKKASEMDLVDKLDV